MAKPTKEGRAAGERLGRSPSTVQGWLDRGYGPAVPLKGRAERAHFEAVERVIGAGGLSPVVSHLTLARDRHPTQALRRVLWDLQQLDPGEEDIQDPEELVADAMARPDQYPGVAAVRRASRSMGTPPDLTARVDISGNDMDKEACETSAHPSEPGLPEVELGSALLAVADAVTGREQEATDLDQLGGFLDQAVLSPLGVSLDERSPDDAEIEFAFMRSAVGIRHGAERWLTEASPDDLARGVEAADKLVDALVVVGLWPSDGGDEERWRNVGRLAPAAVPTLRVLMAVFDIFVPLLGRDEVPSLLLAYVDSLSQARSVLEEPKT